MHPFLHSTAQGVTYSRACIQLFCGQKGLCSQTDANNIQQGEKKKNKKQQAPTVWGANT